jgi:hypothetical protein
MFTQEPTMTTTRKPATPLQKVAALKTAQRVANLQQVPQRVYYAYGLYHVTREDAMYYGGTVAVVHPRELGEAA